MDPGGEGEGNGMEGREKLIRSQMSFLPQPLFVSICPSSPIRLVPPITTSSHLTFLQSF